MSYSMAGLGDNTSSSALVAKPTRELQTLLAAKGFDPGPIDGKWGTRTSTALNRAAAAAGLAADGTVGSGATVNLYLAVWSAINALPSNPVTPGTPNGGRPSVVETAENCAIGKPSTTKTWLPWAIGGGALLGIGAFFYARKPKRAVAANGHHQGRR